MLNSNYKISPTINLSMYLTRISFLTFISVFFLVGLLPGQSVVVNEIMASNATILADEDGDYSDWIELYNPSDNPVDITGYGLSDNSGKPFKWIFPATVINPKEFLVVFASGKNRKDTYHTGFKIDKDGEPILLTKANGVLADYVTPSSIPTDISWGRQPDGTANWFYFQYPTPGLPNDEHAYTGMSPEPEFSIPGGFYDGEQHLQLTVTENGVTIYYTTDGSVPDTSSSIYSAPLKINHTTVLRARTLIPGRIPGKTTTQTYLINESTKLPVISLSTNPENLWDDEIGIYVAGTNGIPGYCSSEPRNWNQDWERPATLELFEPDGRQAFNVDISIKISGGCTRLYPAKSLEVYTRNEFGDTEINYRIFPEKNQIVYNNLVIRTGGQDWYRSSFRDGMIQTLVKNRTDVDCQAFRPAILFINGEYWGIHNLREKKNEHYLAANHGLADPDSIDILSGRYTVVQGSADHYKAVLDYIHTHDLTLDTHYDYIKTQMDVDQFTDYMITEIYCANIDWPGGNIRFWRPRTDEGKWRWILFDTDLSFGAHPNGQYNSNSLENALKEGGSGWPNPDWSTFLLRNLLKNESFKNEFIQRFSVHMATTFHHERVIPIIDSLKAIIESEVPRHLERWPMSFSLGNSWGEHIDIMRSFSQLRPAHMRSHLRQKFKFSAYANFYMFIDSPEGGHIEVHGLNVRDSLTLFRFAGEIPIRCRAIPSSGYRFTGWSGAVETSNDSIVFTFGEIKNLTATFSKITALSPEMKAHTFKLYPVYPNPFNPQTQINYTLPADSHVILSVCNIIGQVVETLVHEYQQSGDYSYQWNSSTFPSGIYFITLNTGNYHAVQKALLIR